MNFSSELSAILFLQKFAALIARVDVIVWNPALRALHMNMMIDVSRVVS